MNKILITGATGFIGSHLAEISSTGLLTAREDSNEEGSITIEIQFPNYLAASHITGIAHFLFFSKLILFRFNVISKLQKFK